MKLQKLNLSKVLAGTLAAATAFTAMPVQSFAGEETYVYGYLNVPYDVFYETYMSLDNATNTSTLNAALNVDTNEDLNLDAVSTATTNKFKSTSLAAGTYNDGTNIKGVTLPVRLTEEDAAALAQRVSSDELTVNNDYYFVASEAELTSSAFVDYTENESLSSDDFAISAMDASENTNQYLGIDDLTYTSSYGDYQITITGLSTSKGLQVGEDEYVATTVYGAIINTSDNGHYAMTALENLWFGTKVANVEIAFSVPDGRQLTNHGGAKFVQMQGLDGATISSITLITSLGVLIVEDTQELNDYTPTPNLFAYMVGDELIINGYPISNADTTVTISGMLDAEEVTFGEPDGNGYVSATVALPVEPEMGTSYTVVLESEGHGPIYTSAALFADENLYGILGYWYGKIAKLVSVTDAGAANYTMYVEHRDEAAALLAETNPNSYEVKSLIAEIKSMVAGAIGTTGSISAASLTDKKLSVTVADFDKLYNPTYALTYKSGRSTVTLASGSLTSNVITIGATPTTGTSYTLTVSSDNYTDAVTTVVATTTPVVTVADKTATYTGSAISVADATISNVADDATGFTTTYTYYTNAACTTKTSKSNSGAASAGAAPVNAGTYYVKATVAANGNYNAATSDAATLVINKANLTVKLTAKSATYTGKAISVAAATISNVVDGATGFTKTYTYYTNAACTTKTSKSNSGAASAGAAPVNAGTYYVKATVAATTNYNAATSAAVKLVIKKKTPTVKVATTSKTISYSKVKSAAQSFKIGGSVTGNGTITYKKTSGSSKITINAKTGAVTVKKGTAKGTYTIKVKVSAAASTNYAAASKTVTIKVVVK
ncbi:MAG: hypothetical protein E7282_06945 [Lachnospiraceae bacterium]|nr:hypothetical protein [Lachnospiraceae bacterium]